MSNRIIYLDAKQVPPHLRGAYKGQKFEVVVCETVHIPMDAGLWSGGSRDRYSAVNLATGKSCALVGQNSSPFDDRRADHTVAVPAGAAVVRHTISRGKDMGLTFYLRPENAAALLPAHVELTETEWRVLSASAMYKSHYQGLDRYGIARQDCFNGLGAFPTRPQWDEAKASLIERKLLTKAGAITNAGRNALETK